jgi:hypothetical protein
MTPEELKRMTKAELLELASRNNLKVTSSMAKPELIKAIAAAGKKTKAPPPAKPKARAAAKDLTPEERRIEAARKVARDFIAGVRSKPRTARKSNASKKASPAEKPVTAEKAAPAKKALEAEKAAPEKRSAATERPAPVVVPAAAPAPKAKRAAKAAKQRPVSPKKPPVAKGGPEEAIRQQAEEGKYYLGAEQRVMPPVEAIEIPRGYNVDRIVAMVRDPYWIFAYWEVTDHKYRELERAFGDTWPKCKMILRVYDKTNEKPAHFDIVLTQDARTWYINVSAERRYQIAIGALSPDGRFELVAISNVVETPSGKVSDRIDEHWMVPDDVFNKIFAASGGHDMHSASGELKALLEKRLLEEISSGAVTSFGSGALYKEAKGRSFRLWVATELILYGGTEPDAHVTVQRKEIKIRPDGTFSIRFALPDGKLELPVTAVSGDGLEERTIDTNVAKKTAKKEPVLR